MKLHPGVTRTAVELVKRFEGLRRRAARLPDGSWTIGYGHTRTAREGAEVREEEAELLLYFDLSEVATLVEAWTFTPLNQNQFEALIAFAFNIGTENFRRSTVLKRINEGQYLQAAAAMELWRKTEVNGEGVVVDALVRRRATEKAHFLIPPDGFKPSPTPVMRPAFDFSVIEAAAQSRAAQQTAEVEAPMEGAEAVAHVERAAATAPAELKREPIPAPSPEAPEPESEPEPEPAPPFVAERAEADRTRAHRSAGQGDVLFVPPAPDAPAASPFGYRGFEPPPPRFDGPVSAPSASEPPAAEPARVAEAAAPGDTLFDRPLPRVSDMPTERVIRAAHDEAAPPRGEAMARIFNNAVVLFGSIGCLGVLLFALTVTSMLTGKPSLAHLLVGLVGVALMTFAGIYFLMKRWGASGDGLSRRDEDRPPE